MYHFFTAGSNASISSNANNRVITGGSGTNLNGEAGLTFDGTELKIGGDSSVSGTFGLEIYNTASNEGTALIAGTAGARLDIMDTGSSERLRIAAAGAIYFISYKSGDDIIFQATTGSGTAEKLRITSGGNVQLPVNGQQLTWGASQQMKFYYENSEDRMYLHCLLYTSPSPRDRTRSRMPSSA